MLKYNFTLSIMWMDTSKFFEIISREVLKHISLSTAWKCKLFLELVFVERVLGIYMYSCTSCKSEVGAPPLCALKESGSDCSVTVTCQARPAGRQWTVPNC